jgi:hypothetical protein
MYQTTNIASKEIEFLFQKKIKKIGLAYVYKY